MATSACPARSGLLVRPAQAQDAAGLAREGIRPPFAAVYSDSARDLPLLCETARPVLVRPDRRSLLRVHRRLRGAIETLR